MSTPIIFIWEYPPGLTLGHTCTPTVVRGEGAGGGGGNEIVGYEHDLANHGGVMTNHGKA